jgi:hypothetical protein
MSSNVATYSTIELTPLQKKWLQTKQIMINEWLEKADAMFSDNGNMYNAAGEAVRHVSTWDYWVVLQGKVTSEAPDLNIPPEAVPNVKACWDAIRCAKGRGMIHLVKLL